MKFRSTIILFIFIYCFTWEKQIVESAAIKYDQRQEGEVNVRADLENFVVLIIPTSSSSSLSLLDLITKTLPGKKIKKKIKNQSGDQQQMIIEEKFESDDDLKHFIESKSAAPYRVDISRTRSNLAKLHPDIVESINEEVLISPTIQLSKDVMHQNENGAEIKERFKKAITVVPDEFNTIADNHGEKFEKKPIPLTDPTEHNQSLWVPNINENSTDDPNDELKEDLDAVKNEYPSGELVLIGATEQCGPLGKRDKNGVCHYITEEQYFKNMNNDATKSEQITV